MHLIGRTRELEFLRSEVLEALDRASGRVVVVEGAAGVGKTALLGDLADIIAAERPDATVARGACHPGRPEPFLPFLEALEALGHGRGQSSVQELLLELAPEWLQLVPVVGGVLSAGVATATRIRKSGRTSDERLFSEYLKVLEHLAADAPVVLVLDDLHLADAASAALLAHLGRRIRDLPLALVLAMKPPLPGEDALVLEVLPELERERLAVRYPVAELDQHAAAELASRELGGPLSAEVEQWLLEGAGGNPLFLTQLVALLRDSGAVVQGRDSAWALRKGQAPPALPASAEDATVQRLGHLDPEQHRLLQYAAVQGRVFDSTVLRRVLDLDELTVLDDLERLVRDHRLVVPVGEADYGSDVGTRFRFAEAAVHRILDRQVLGKRRVLLCRRMAEVLEELLGENRGEASLTLARLHREARQEDRAAAYARAAPAPDGQVKEPRATAASGREPASPSDGPRSEKTPEARFVGRAQELATLESAIQTAVSERRGQVLLVEGPTGTGKSTLAAELLRRATETLPELSVARGRCLQAFEATDPYLPFVTALQDLADESTIGSVERERLSKLVVELAPYWLSAVPVVGSILSASFITATAVKERRAPPSREALFEQYVDLVRTLADQGPLLLFLEDLHWADRSSLELLAAVAARIADLPLVVMGTLRPPSGPSENSALAAVVEDLCTQELATRFQLAELPEEAVAGLIESELGGEISKRLLRWMYGVTGGNPLFTSELTRLLLESGAVAHRHGEWELTDRVHEVGVPRTAEAVLERRIERLDPSEARLLQYASVAGAEFDSVIVSRLLEAAEQDVHELLAALEAHQLLAPAGSTTKSHGGEVASRYRFRHALVHAVVYDRVKGKRRVLLHRRAGEILEELHRDETHAVAAPLARHFHVGRLGGRAFKYGQMAADAARGLFANWEAEELYRIAREHSPDGEAAVDMDERLGDLYDRLGYYEQAAEHFGRVATSESAGRARKLRVRRKMVAVDRKTGDTPAPALLARVERLLPEASDVPRERCYLLLELARLPDATNSVEAAMEAVSLAASMGDPALEADALDRLAIALIFRDRPAAALPHLDRALELSKGRENPIRGSLNRNLAGIAYGKLGDYPRALACFREMLEMGERSGELNAVAAACVNLGQMLLRLGKLDEAENVLQRALKFHERRERASTVHSLFNLAERARRTGDWRLAAERYRQLRERAREFGYWTVEAVACSGFGLTALAAGRPDDARAAGREAVALMGEHDEWFEDREYVELLLARLAELDGHLDESLARLERTAEALEELDRYPWGVIQLERARMLAVRDLTGALALVDAVDRATRGSGSDLEGEVERVRRELEGAVSASEAATLSAR